MNDVMKCITLYTIAYSIKAKIKNQLNLKDFI